MAFSKEGQSKAALSDVITPTISSCTERLEQDLNNLECEDDLLRQLDLELDQRINQVLKISRGSAATHVARISHQDPRRSSSQKVACGPTVSQSTTLPSNTDRTGAVISISNGNIETQSGTVSWREPWPSGIEPYGLGHKLPKAGIGKINYCEDSKKSEVVSVPGIVTTNNVSDRGTHGEQLNEGVNESNSSYSEEMKYWRENDHANKELKGTRVYHDGREERWDNMEYIRKDGGTGNIIKEGGSEETSNSEKDIKEEQDAIFDDFLDTCTRSRLKLLTTKVASLTQTLQAAKEECNSLTASKREANRAVQVGEVERRALSKRVIALQQDSARLTRTNAQLNTRVKELTSECQAVQKEVSSIYHREGERRGSHTALQAQLTRARAESANLRDQLTSLKFRHKEEAEELRGQLAEAETKNRGLERARRNLATLTSKQQRLIEVLEKQKSNIAAGRAVAGLEEKFLATIAPLHPP
ncbi:hypothetical protein Pmani_008898 [Petrolisthes manimaculis]|uniref:Uncharacterized protein n=1 Tax=Petrolisthes manimaculis TaxID=1843537 RepID=A0AAE1UE57_9EUCA|nr:hypothetical protein Pmani_008898 [Petrolisthes manimaculis]